MFVLLLAGCAASVAPDPQLDGSAGSWRPGQALMQGHLGATLLNKVEQDGGSVPGADGSGETLAQFPTIGGGAQWKVGGGRIDLGAEGMFDFGFRSNGTAFVSSGGSTAIAVKVDMQLFELYGGPFISVPLGDRWRVYAAAGPVMQWANYDQEGPSAVDVDGNGSGFGTGLYARTGLEMRTRSNTLVGLGVRWVDSRIDLDGGLGDLDLAGTQVVLTVSRMY